MMVTLTFRLNNSLNTTIFFSGRRQWHISTAPVRHVSKLLPYSRRMGPPCPKHTHGDGAPPVQQKGRVPKIDETHQAGVLPDPGPAQGVLHLQQEISLARLNVDTQKDAYGGEAVHVSVLLQGVQRKKQPAETFANVAR